MDARSAVVTGSQVFLAHQDSSASTLRPQVGSTRAQREEREHAELAPGATRATSAGRRARPEEPDRWRTCFERDRDRIQHSSAFRRLAGKTQVFVFPEDHQRSRLTHAIEVAQVATSIARACGLNVALTEAIALGHDCGHGPGGHASEDAFAPYLPEGFDHAPWGAKVSLASLNLCEETLDGIANHSWSRPAPSTCEGEVVSWADRIAYVCHDFEDACATGIVSGDDLPRDVRNFCGDRRSSQLGSFINSMTLTTIDTGRIGMDQAGAAALASFRSFNYERIYMRDESLAQAQTVIRVLRGLVDYYATNLGAISGIEAGDAAYETGERALRAAITYVAGMTDRFAFHHAVSLLGWHRDQLPRHIDD